MFDSIIISDFTEYLKRQGKKPNTIYLQINVIKSFIKKGYNFERYQDYNIFLEEHSIYKRSKYYFDVLRNFVKWKFKDKKEIKNLLLDAIKMTGFKEKDPVKQTEFLSEEQKNNIIKYMSLTKHSIIAWIQKETGVRAGDVIRLKRDDIEYNYDKDDKDVSLNITFHKKGDRISKIPIFDPHLIEYIEDRLAEIDGEEEYVFIDRSVVNNNHTYDTFFLERRNYRLYWEDLRETCAKLGINTAKFSTHDWRRNFANKVWVDILDKKDIVALQRALDHKDVSSTVRYLRQSGMLSRDIFKKIQKEN